MKTMSVKLSDGLHAKLQRAAKRGRGSKFDLMRAALEAYLDGDRTETSTSFFAAAKKWIG